MIRFSSVMLTILITVLAVGTASMRSGGIAATSNDDDFAAVASRTKGPFVFDLHAQLNEQVGDQWIVLPEGYSVVTDEEGRRSIKTSDGEQIGVSKFWKVKESNCAPIVLQHRFTSFGVIGDKTRGMVTLLQLGKNLSATGVIDDVTMQHLRPLRPVSRPLLNAVMSWFDDSVHSSVLPLVDSNFLATTRSEAETANRPVVALNREAVQFDKINIIKIDAAATISLFIIVTSLIAFFFSHFASRLLDRYLNRRFGSEQNRAGKLLLFSYFQRARIFQSLAHLAPATLIYASHWIFPDYWVHEVGSVQWWQYPSTFIFWNHLFAGIGIIYLIVSLMFISLSVVNAVEGWLTPEDCDGNSALSGIMRFTRGTVWAVAVLFVGAGLAGVTPLKIIGSLGVFMTVIVLLFRDSLLGLVASVQIVSNSICKVGDWIEMPKYGADGEVMTMSLNMIKVQNFDKTVSTVPTHAVLSESFRNWSTIHEAGGRRMKRAVFIDMHSIKPCSPEMIERFQQQISKVAALVTDGDDTRKLKQGFTTNIGGFRNYIIGYLQSIDDVHQGEEMTFLVRHLDPTAKGLPLEIYAFCSKTAWIEYEAIQADIFEHVLSMLPEFDLRVFQDRSDTRGELRDLTASQTAAK